MKWPVKLIVGRYGVKRIVALNQSHTTTMPMKIIAVDLH